MGELIAFKLPKAGMRSNPRPNQTGLIVIFPGVRREHVVDPDGAVKRSRRGLQKQPGKGRNKSQTGRVNDTGLR
jgi:hypothetical protein